MLTLRNWHTATGAILALLLLLMLFSESWVWVPPVLALAAVSFLGANFAFAWLGRSRLSEAKLWDVSEFRHHEEFSLAAAVDLWKEERPDSALELAVKLRLRAAAAGGQTAPWTKRPAVAWRFEAQAMKPSRLGAEGDLVPVADQTSIDGLVLEDGPDRVIVHAPGLVNLGNLTETFTTWPQAARRSASNLLDSGRIAAGVDPLRYPSLRIRETWLGAGEWVTAFGQLSRGPDGFVLRGSDIPDDPSCLLVVSDRAQDKRRRRQRRSATFWLNAVLLAASLPFAAWMVMLSPLFPSYVGPVRITPHGQNLVVLATSPGEDPDVWTFDSTDTGMGISLTSGGNDWTASADRVITVTRFNGPVSDYGPDQELHLTWQDSTWRLDPAHPWTPGDRSGHLVVRNLGARSVTLRLPGNPTAGSDSWAFGSHEGAESGLYLEFDGHALDVAEGQLVTVEQSRQVVRSLIVGLSPEMKWDPEDSTWNLDLTAAALSAKPAPLWVTPLPDKHVHGVLADPTEGQAVTFDLPAEAGGAPRAVQALVGGAFTVSEAQTLRVTQADETVLYTGRLGSCPFVKWQGDHWLLSP